MVDIPHSQAVNNLKSSGSTVRVKVAREVSLTAGLPKVSISSAMSVNCGRSLFNVKFAKSTFMSFIWFLNYINIKLF